MKSWYIKPFVIFLLSIFLISSSAFCQSKKRVAIIAFKNLSGDVSLDYIGSGFGETLTTKLSKVKELDLIERMQIFKIFEEQKLQLSGFVEPKSAVQAGKILGVQYTIIGSFQKAGNKLKADTRLVNVETGKIDAADDVVGDYEDIFSLQEELALKLAKSLNAPVSQEEKIEIAKKPAENLSAYEWFAKGLDNFEKEKYDEAISCFEKAIAIDKNYIDAWFFLAISCDHFAYKVSDEIQRKSLRDRAKRALEQIVTIYETTKDTNISVNTLNQIALAYLANDNMKGMDIFQESLKLADKRGDKKGKMETYIRLAEIYDDVGNPPEKNSEVYKKALDYWNNALKIAEEIKDYKELNYICSRLALFYSQTDNNQDMALSFYQKSFTSAEKVGDQKAMAKAHYHLGDTYRKKKHYEKALENLQMALKIYQKLGDQEKVKWIEAEIKMVENK